MKRRDVFLILLLLAAALVFWLVTRDRGEPGTEFAVLLDGKTVLRKSLLVNSEYVFEQEDGSRNVVAVEEGQVYMRESNCRDGICIHQGRISSTAKTIVCLPHKLVVQVLGNSEDEDLDVVIQ